MLCRLCLYECCSNESTSLFNNEEENYLIKLITKYMYIEISQNDSLSVIICQKCRQHLNDFDKFVQFVEERQTSLQNEFLDLKYESISNVNENFMAMIEHNQEPLLDIKDVQMDEDQEEFGLANNLNLKLDEDEENMPLMNLFKKEENKRKNKNNQKNRDAEFIITKQIKHNQEQVLDVKDVQMDDSQEEFGLANNFNVILDIDEVKNEDNLTLKNLFKKDKTENRVKENPNNLETRKLRLKIIKKIDRKAEEEKEVMPKFADKMEKTRTQTKRDYSASKNKLKDEFIAKYIRLKCEICEKPANSLNDLRTHFRNEHHTKAYVTCCGTRFKRRFVLYDHVTLHLNPEQFKCELCNKVLKSTASLENHYANIHTELLERRFQCKFCDKRFANSSSYNSHLLGHTTAKNHICDICNKGFKSKHQLKHHIKFVHENLKKYVCEICGQEYKFKKNFVQHVAEHSSEHKELTEQCPTCHKWFRPNGLRFHIKRHELVDSKCEKCGKVVKSQMALKAHIRYYHSEKPLYKCTYCDKEFKRPCVLKEHIAMHTGQMNYKCSHCSREFRSKANMYAHVKKMHTKEWQLAQEARNRGPSEIKTNVSKINC